MITPILRDDILRHLANNRKGLEVHVHCKSLSAAVQAEEAFVLAILNEFQKNGLIGMMPLTDVGDIFIVFLTAQAIEYSQSPWFQAKAEVEHMQIEKLIEELDHIKEQIGVNRYNAMVGTLSLVASIVGLSQIK